jgi:hypothetical protein
VTPGTGAQPGEMSPVDGSGPRELLRYRSAQGRWEVAAMILGSWQQFGGPLAGYNLLQGAT